MLARHAWIAFGLALLATVYAPALTLAEQGVAGAFRYFAADAFYYLAVADHSVGAAFYTFDGRFPTNGFHPLWQYSLSFAFAKLGLASDGQVLFAFGSSVLLTALGSGFFAAAMQRVTGSVALALLASVPGFYYLLLPSLNAHYFAQWSFANGMESALSILFFGVLCFLLVNRRLLAGPVSAAGAFLLATLLTLLTFCRLDDVFLFVPFGAFLLASPGSTQERVRRLVAFGVVPLVCIGAYLAYNLSYAGTLMPVSGAAKNEGLVFGFLRNGYALVTTLFPFVDPFGRGNAVWGSEAWRVLQMVLPAGAAALWIAGCWRDLRAHAEDERSAQRIALTLLCVYVILKAGYNFTLVRLWHQGQWYFPVSIMVFNWIVAATVAAGIERLRAATPGERRGRAAAALGLATALVFVLLQANAFAEVKRSGRFGLGNYHFWERRDAIGRELERVCPGCGVVEFDDGILSYSLPMPVMSGIGLTLDKVAFDAQRRGELLDVAWERGFRLLATLNYPMPAGAYADPEQLRQALAANDQLRGQKLEAWDFETIYVDPGSGVSFVGFRPKAGKP
jgi:hypothetical protein